MKVNELELSVEKVDINGEVNTFNILNKYLFNL
jgi:hypothetical protein